MSHYVRTNCRAQSQASGTPGPGTRASSRRARPLAVAWLAAGVAAYAVSVLVYHHLLATNPTLWGHTDEFVYRAAGIEIHQHPADLYRAHFGEPDRFKLPFTYPPIAALVFALFTSFSFAVWQSALVGVDVLLLPVICYVSLRVAGRRGLTAVALAFAVAAMALWLEPVYTTLHSANQPDPAGPGDGRSHPPDVPVEGHRDRHRGRDEADPAGFHPVPAGLAPDPVRPGCHAHVRGHGGGRLRAAVRRP